MVHLNSDVLVTLPLLHLYNYHVWWYYYIVYYIDGGLIKFSLLMYW